MILTPNMIERMRRYWRIDEHLEKMLLQQLGTEPYPHIYSEQDLHEQSRKMIERYIENPAAAKSQIVPGRARSTEYTKKKGGDIH